MGGDPTMQGVNDDAQRDGSDAPGCTLQAAISFIRGSVQADAARNGGIPEGEEGGFEWRALLSYAASCNALIDPGRRLFRLGGREHDVVHESSPDSGDRWWKATKRGNSGYFVELGDREPLFLPATPVQYLRRLQMQNDLFGDDIRLEGVIVDALDMHRIVTSQRDVAGDVPSSKEIHDHLFESGFRRLNIPPMGYYHSHSYLRGQVGLFDAHPANFMLSEGFLLPIDVILVEFSPEDAAHLQKRRV